ncbi:MAG: hypothetical protein ABWZ91_12730 [Nocardioides sp.]
MLIVGLLLVAAGAAVIVAAVFTAEVTGGQIEIIGVEVGAVTLFVLGVASAVAILWGFSIGKFGARRSLRQRRENQRLEELSAKLDRVEAERRGEGDDTHPL